MSEIGLSLQGKFKFDLYDKSGNLLKSSDYINNFITKSGVYYPYHFAFADCFRFLSVGSGNLKNSIRSIDETIALDKPIEEFSYIGSRSDFLFSGSTNYSYEPACGYRFPSENVIELYREWTLPNNSGGDAGAFQNPGTFTEFMVTPGRPYVIAPMGEKFCTCDDKSGIFEGLDCSSISEYYDWVHKKSKNLSDVKNKKIRICDADKAFARILLNNPINYPSGSTLNVTYKLSITIDSGVKLKSFSKPNIIQPDSNWNAKINSVFNITNPGIKLINDGQTRYSSIRGPKQLRLQHFNYDKTERSYSFINEYGESFVPPHGIPLEPSNLFLGQQESLRNIIYYLSEDNIQFLVSSSGGKFLKTGEFAPWNVYVLERTYYSGDYVYSGNTSYQYINQIPQSGKSLNNISYWKNLNTLKVVEISNSGLKLFKNDVEKAINDPYEYWGSDFSPKNEYDIRKNGIFPNTEDILYDSTNSKKFYETPELSEPIVNIQDRIGKVSYIFNFKNYNSILYAKSFVASYKDIEYQDIPCDTSRIPFFDLIFSGTGNLFTSKIITGIKEYVGGLNNTGAFISGVEDNSYFYIGQSRTYPILNSSLTWSVPCPQGVSGCP